MTIAQTQMYLIQSLSEAMSWFQREVSWGIEPTELRHLCGRMGELYAAVVSNGRMAIEPNQRGYDVVSADNERISVKTTAVMGNSGIISFNAKTLNHVDRVMILRVNSDEMQIEILLDALVDKAEALMSMESNGKRTISLSRLISKPPPKREIVKPIKAVQYYDYFVRELETGAIEVEKDGKLLKPVKPALREIAVPLNIKLESDNGNVLTTRQLGSQIINFLLALREHASASVA